MLSRWTLAGLLIPILGATPLAGWGSDQDRLVTALHPGEGRVARLVVTTSRRAVADGRDLLGVTVIASDALGRSVQHADIEVALVFGANDDEVEARPARDEGLGVYRLELTSWLAGPVTVQARDRATDVTATAEARFVPAAAARVRLFAGEPQEGTGSLRIPLMARVEDEHANPLPPRRTSLRFASDFGRIRPREVEADGSWQALLVASRPGRAVVQVRDRPSGLAATREVVIPAIRLRAPAALHLTDTPGEDRTIPLTVQVFTGAAALGAYEIVLQINERTRFVRVLSGDPAGRFAPPRVELVGPDRVRISQRVALPADRRRDATGLVTVATLLFECTGEGTSEFQVAAATLVSLSGLSSVSAQPSETGLQGRIPPGALLADEPTQPAVCQNKRVKFVCIKLILLDIIRDVDKAKEIFKSELKHIQANLDEGCCRIDVRYSEKDDAAVLKVADVPAYKDELDAKKNRVTWDYGKPSIELSPGLAELMCKAGLPRDDDCINVYVVPDDSLTYPKGKLAGADIRRQRINSSGKGCDDMTFKGTENFPDCKPTGVLISPAALAASSKDKDKDKDFNPHPLKHEVGHLLGLRHVRAKGLDDAYDKSVLEAIEKDEARAKDLSSVMTYDSKRAIYTKTECQMIMENNCNGFIRRVPK